MKYDLGQVVQLRSGGPDMTVVSVGTGFVFKCSWFTPDCLYSWADFEEHELQDAGATIGFIKKETK